MPGKKNKRIAAAVKGRFDDMRQWQEAITSATATNFRCVTAIEPRPGRAAPFGGELHDGFHG